MNEGAGNPRLGARRDPPRRRRLWLVGAVVGIVAVGLMLYRYARRPVYAGPVQHVIVISMDTTRADHLGCYGNRWIQTPNLDALASESILFTNYMTVATTTLASHTSLFTGKYPHHHGVARNGFLVNDDNVMLTELLHQAGFRCAGFLGSFALDKRFGFAQGFDEYNQDFDILVGSDGSGQNQRRAESVTDAVIAYLNRVGVPRNLFLFVHYFDPHRPYSPPPPYDTLYGEGVGMHKYTVRDHPALVATTPNEVKTQLFRYAGEVTYMDRHIGRLLDDLKQRGILEHALVVVTSDHGENLTDESGEPFDHGWTVYDAEAKAVCLIRLPRAAHGGTKYTGLTASVDILPTLVRYLGLPAPAGVDGEALDLLSLGASPSGRTRFAEATKPWQEAESDSRWLNLQKAHCVRRGDLKYIRTDCRGTEELYDLARDAHERHNLLADPAAGGAEIAAELRDLLAAWDASAAPLPSRFDPGQTEESIRRLKSLGYLGGSEPPAGSHQSTP